MKTFTNQRGFTLVEMLIVVTLLGILATIGAGSYTKSLKRARDGRVRSDIQQIHKALELYYSMNGSYPDNTQGIYNDATINNSTFFQTGKVPHSPVSTNPQGDNYYYTRTSDGYCLCSHALEADRGNSEDTSCTYTEVKDDADFFCASNSQ